LLPHGTAADLIKIAMANIHNDLNEQGFKSRMLLQVHDELVFELVPDEEEKLRSILNDRMINALPSLNEKVPVEIEIGTGKNWLEAH
jgi:DNA polymerase-1